MAERIAKKADRVRVLNGVSFDLADDVQRKMYFSLVETSSKATVKLDAESFSVSFPIIREDVLSGLGKGKDDVPSGAWHQSSKRITKSVRYSGKGFNGFITLSIDPEIVK